VNRYPEQRRERAKKKLPYGKGEKSPATKKNHLFQTRTQKKGLRYQGEQPANDWKKTCGERWDESCLHIKICKVGNEKGGGKLSKTKSISRGRSLEPYRRSNYKGISSGVSGGGGSRRHKHVAGKRVKMAVLSQEGGGTKVF